MLMMFGIAVVVGVSMSVAIRQHILKSSPTNGSGCPCARRSIRPYAAPPSVKSPLFSKPGYTGRSAVKDFGYQSSGSGFILDRTNTMTTKGTRNRTTLTTDDNWMTQREEDICPRLPGSPLFRVLDSAPDYVGHAKTRYILASLFCEMLIFTILVHLHF